MAYPGVFYSDDGQILRAMQRSAENGIAIDVLVEQALARGETDPRYHGEARKALLEAEESNKATPLRPTPPTPCHPPRGPGLPATRLGEGPKAPARPFPSRLDRLACP